MCSHEYTPPITDAALSPSSAAGLAPWLAAPPDGAESVEWRAAPHLLPPDWVEAEQARGPDFEARRLDALKFASRRRMESETQKKLAEEPLPPPFTTPSTSPSTAPYESR